MSSSVSSSSSLPPKRLFNSRFLCSSFSFTLAISFTAFFAFLFVSTSASSLLESSFRRVSTDICINFCLCIAFPALHFFPPVHTIFPSPWHRLHAFRDRFGFPINAPELSRASLSHSMFSFCCHPAAHFSRFFNSTSGTSIVCSRSHVADNVTNLLLVSESTRFAVASKCLHPFVRRSAVQLVPRTLSKLMEFFEEKPPEGSEPNPSHVWHVWYPVSEHRSHWNGDDASSQTTLMEYVLRYRCLLLLNGGSLFRLLLNNKGGRTENAEDSDDARISLSSDR